MNEDSLDGSHRRWFHKPAVWAAIGLATTAICCGTVVFDVPGWILGETDIHGNYADEVELAEQVENLTPMERLHAELFPRWAIALANGHPDEERAWTEFSEAIEDDELGDVAVRLREALRNVDPSRPLQPLLDPWNERLESMGEPFYVTGSLAPTATGVAGVLEFYAVMATPTARIGDEELPAIVLQRIDRTNVREPYFGRTYPDSGRAIIVVDRVVDFALDSMWLPLTEGRPPEDPVEVALFPQVRAEMKRALGAEHFAVLVETAPLRRKLFDTMAANGSRATCGSGMRWAPEVPFDGFSNRTLDLLDAYAEADKIQPCPRVKFDEADAIREATEALRDHRGLEPALEALVAWLAESTVTHEIRHLADDRRHDGLATALPCEACPDGASVPVRAELSAYASSFASSDEPVTALYQDCISVRGGGAHRRAMGLLASQMDVRCDEPAPDDLRQRARDAERHFFGREETIVLADVYPDQLPVRWWR